MNKKKGLPLNMSKESFRAYLLNNTYNKTILWISALASIIQFSIFKYFYPYVNFIYYDSFAYLETASKNMDINTYMIGYSRFLRLFSVFTRSDTALAVFQYLLIQSSALFFLFTLFYFYRPSKLIQITLICFVTFNPLFMHLGNLVSSDGFFLSLSLIWFSLLLWIVHRPTIRIAVWHMLILFITFTVRPNALIYPAITVFAFLLSRQPASKKLAHIGGSILLCGLFILYTGNKYKALTGAWQYSPFSGWLLANNAMYVYENVDISNYRPVPERFKGLDNMMRAYFSSPPDIKIQMAAEVQTGHAVYMWATYSPLVKYMHLQFTNDSTAGFLRRWATVAPLYADYGAYIIRKYPLQYVKYFLWPNAWRYYAPSVELMGAYNAGDDQVPRAAQRWFGYKSTKVFTRTKDPKIKILYLYSICSGMANIGMLLGLLCFSILNGFRMDTLFRKAVLLAGTIWLLNMGFTIFASAAALRFQSFPIVLGTTFSLLLVDWLYKIWIKEKKMLLDPKM